ncbi:hypothetical protein M5K25_022901 [Dendrobium thyrsiflorum]|uniref:Multiprotein bridging factor 1 N-terminal domain-containing protein n=1 Tax=Dendrobium thyrsiflorum TaxID=117978 RepID=A0ABD0UDG4_DENTH
MAGIGPIMKDREPVLIHKKAPNTAAKRDEKIVNTARRTAALIETLKKCKLLYHCFFFSPLCGPRGLLPVLLI